MTSTFFGWLKVSIPNAFGLTNSHCPSVSLNWTQNSVLFLAHIQWFLIWRDTILVENSRSIPFIWSLNMRFLIPQTRKILHFHDLGYDPFCLDAHPRISLFLQWHCHLERRFQIPLMGSWIHEWLTRTKERIGSRIPIWKRWLLLLENDGFGKTASTSTIKLKTINIRITNWVTPCIKSFWTLGNSRPNLVVWAPVDGTHLWSLVGKPQATDKEAPQK